MSIDRIYPTAMLFVVVLICSATSLQAGAHTWDVNEIFRNADGSVWFVELREVNGTPNEVNVGNHDVTSNSSSFTIASNVASPTGFKHLLFGNSAFAALPGAVMPDQIVDTPFSFSVFADTVTYSPYDTLVYGPGQLPTDGLLSLNGDLTTGVNSPTNYLGQTGSVDAGASGGGSVAVELAKLPGPVTLSWNASCASGDDEYGIYEGNLTTLLTTGTYNHTQIACGVLGLTANVTPAHAISYFLVVPGDGSVEGYYGSDTSGSQRPQGTVACATRDVTCTPP